MTWVPSSRSKFLRHCLYSWNIVKYGVKHLNLLTLRLLELYEGHYPSSLFQSHDTRPEFFFFVIQPSIFLLFFAELHNPWCCILFKIFWMVDLFMFGWSHSSTNPSSSLHCGGGCCKNALPICKSWFLVIHTPPLVWVAYMPRRLTHSPF